MKKLFQFVAMFLFCLFATCCMTPTHIESPKQDKHALIKDINDSTVALVIDNEIDAQSITTQGMKAYCAGVWINKNSILTAAHCVEDAGKPETEDEDNDETLTLLKKMLHVSDWNPINQPITYITKDEAFDDSDVNVDMSITLPSNGIVIAYSKPIDLALIKSSTHRPHSIASLATQTLATGDDVFCVGHTLGLMWSYSEGKISQTRIMSGANHYDYKVFQISAPVSVGNSGGGAFNSKGELVGLMSYYMPMGEDVAFFVHTDVIRKFLFDHQSELDR